MEIHRVRWLDASAIIKFLVDEDGSQQVRTYLREHGPFDTTWLCLGEVLGCLKGRCKRRQMTQEEYLALCEILLGWVYDSPAITVHDMPSMGFREFRDLQNLVKKYNIDFSDALQVYILKTHDFLSTQKPMLITADHRLAKAAHEDLIDVWDCTKGPPPS